MARVDRVLIKFSRQQEGTVAPIFGLLFIPMIFLVGMSVDTGRAIRVKANMQNALDSATLAGLRADASQRQTVADGFFSTNFTEPSDAITSSHGFSSPEPGKYVGTASATLRTMVGGLFGHSTLTVNVTSTAAGTVTASSTTSPCAIALDPSASKSFQLISTSSVPASECEIHVHSGHSSAAYVHSPSSTSFKKVCVKGGKSSDSDTSVPSSIHFQKDCDSPLPDPLAGTMPTVTPDACTAANTNRTLSGTVNPGTYCGWTVFGGSTLTMNPGLYVIVGGTLTINASVVKGDGVTFYLADYFANLNYKSKEDGSSNKFYAPTSGTYKDLLIFEAPGLPGKYMSIDSTDKQKWAGIIYLPSKDLTINSTSDWVSCKCFFVVNKLKLDSLSKFPWTPYKTFEDTSTVTVSDIHLE